MMTIENIKRRNEILSLIRDFFNARDYLEVETPLVSPYLIPESSIEIFKTTFRHPFKENKPGYLIPSPEVWLKQFISKNPVNIFEISKCFRNSEQSGSQHNPEFTMVEYYTMDYTSYDSIELTKKLLNKINSTLPYSRLPRDHRIMTMDEAFIKYAGFSLLENHTIKLLHKMATERGIPIERDDNWETAFNRIFIDLVEPNLPKDVNLFLIDFPANIKTLAKNIPGTPWSQRWELYINGIETGNCYSEERDPVKVKEFFKAEGREKIKSMEVHDIDGDYYRIFETFPECSGGAIGVDRLIMAILGVKDIQGVILFPYHDTIK